MQKHQLIDQRSLELAKAIVQKIDSDPERKGLRKALSVCIRWYKLHRKACIREWLEILKNREWNEIKEILLDPSEEGKRLRQNSPFCGILTPKERWDIYRRFM